MYRFSCACRECELCFPRGVDFICAGGSIGEDELYYKRYGDIIRIQELDKYHYCMGFHQGLGYFWDKEMRKMKKDEEG